MVFTSPKLNSEKTEGRVNWYPYYAGFSRNFVASSVDFLEENRTTSGALNIFDPWAGSGTSLCVAAEKGHNAWGLDLNPAMVVVAKARCLSKREKSSLEPIAKEIISLAKIAVNISSRLSIENDPLGEWFTRLASIHIRALANSIDKLLVDGQILDNFSISQRVSHFSDLASFYYVALFRAAKRFTSSFQGTNPTWLKQPKDANRINLNLGEVFIQFSKEVEDMIQLLETAPSDLSDLPGAVNVCVGNSTSPPAFTSQFDAIIGSPPYCTRIDYVMATAIELSTLGIGKDLRKKLRMTMMGTPLTSSQPPPDAKWGSTCLRFLEQVRKHSSKAASTYYTNFHISYFSRLYASISALSSQIRKDGYFIIVVQDSTFKGIRNDLASIVTEMAESRDFSSAKESHFVQSRSMGRINPKSKVWTSATSLPIESVIALRR